jgi:DNA modification methylase
MTNSNISADLQGLAVPIGNLKGLPDNPRKGDVDAVAKSYEQFGQLKPIVARRHKQTKDGFPTGVVIAGNHQLLAATKLGWPNIAVVWVDTDAKTAKAFALADNRTHDLGSYDKELLVTLLQELETDLPLFDATGYTAKDLKILIAATGGNTPIDGLTDADHIPEAPEQPQSVQGSIWVLGDHRLICGDSTDPDVWAKVLDGDKADMCFTDPPYNVNYGNTLKDQNEAFHTSMDGKGPRPILNDNLGEDFYPFLLKVCNNIVKYTNGGVYICMSSSELDVLQKAWRESGGHWSTFIIWAKSAFTMGRSDYQRQYEPILYGWPLKAKRYFTEKRTEADVWEYPRPKRNDLHPTMKPIPLVERALANSSLPEGIIVDPFGGSGTTIIASQRLGRKCRMIELDEKYCDVIAKRWAEYTGLEPIHIKP